MHLDSACLGARMEFWLTKSPGSAAKSGIWGGTPVLREARTLVKALFNYLAEGLSLDYFFGTFLWVARERASAIKRCG